MAITAYCTANVNGVRVHHIYSSFAAHGTHKALDVLVDMAVWKIANHVCCSFVVCCS